MFPSARAVTPEILDTLDAGHPEAVRSRRDLRRLDWFLGGSRWIVRSVLDKGREAGAGVVEIGAGGGRVCEILAASVPAAPVTGLDLADRPAGLNPRVHWERGDLFQTLPDAGGGIVVGSLILHHFSEAELRVLGGMLVRFRVLVFSEPLRTPWSLGLSRLARPFVGSVTRHDMPASILAGFQTGELASLLGLDNRVWRISEVARFTGVLRFKAWRDSSIR